MLRCMSAPTWTWKPYCQRARRRCHASTSTGRREAIFQIAHALAWSDAVVARRWPVVSKLTGPRPRTEGPLLAFRHQSSWRNRRHFLSWRISKQNRSHRTPGESSSIRARLGTPFPVGISAFSLGLRVMGFPSSDLFGGPFGCVSTWKTTTRFHMDLTGLRPMSSP
jgi:hypothetical protein